MTLLGEGRAEQVVLDPPARKAGLALLEKALFRLTEAEGECEENEVRFHFASDIYGECEYAAAQVRLLLMRGARLNEIAVAAGDFESYRLPLTAAFSRYEIPYYISENAALETKSAAALLLRALKGRWFWLFGPYCIVAGLLTLIFC